MLSVFIVDKPNYLFKINRLVVYKCVYNLAFSVEIHFSKYLFIELYTFPQH